MMGILTVIVDGEVSVFDNYVRHYVLQDGEVLRVFVDVLDDGCVRVFELEGYAVTCAVDFSVPSAVSARI